MSRIFSLASWNVRHFGQKPKGMTKQEWMVERRKKIRRVTSFLAEQDTDVFGIFEVEGKDVFEDLIKKMPDWQFFITEGPQTMEILVGVRRGITAFLTQRDGYKHGQTFLRPGLLVTLDINNVYYPILFLHSKSFPKPIGFGLRDETVERALKFKKTVDRRAGENNPANFLVLGDFNTMGLDYSYGPDIEAEDEIYHLKRRADVRNMKLLNKDTPHTWWQGPGGKLGPSNLDHVVASEHLKFNTFQGAAVSVPGWPKLGTLEEQAKWIREYSDHALLYCEITAD